MALTHQDVLCTKASQSWWTPRCPSKLHRPNKMQATLSGAAFMVVTVPALFPRQSPHVTMTMVWRAWLIPLLICPCTFWSCQVYSALFWLVALRSRSTGYLPYAFPCIAATFGKYLRKASRYHVSDLGAHTFAYNETCLVWSLDVWDWNDQQSADPTRGVRRDCWLRLRLWLRHTSPTPPELCWSDEK